MVLHWKDILDKKVVNHEDKYRCEFFVKLIYHLASNLSFKVEILREYHEFIDSAYNLKGITQNANFLNNVQ